MTLMDEEPRDFRTVLEAATMPRSPARAGSSAGPRRPGSSDRGIRVIACFLAALVFGVAAHAAAQPAGADANATGATSRPRVGLVLSGGGARGYAHLGVLRVLEENRIPVDYVAGTSMGAVVGGLYASGRPVDQLIADLLRVDLTNIAFDRNERAALSQSRREDEFGYPIGFYAGYGDGRIKLPTGFIQGNRFLVLLQDWTSQLPGNLPFDRLPVPFRAIATDLETGQEVVLSHGSLPHAIRASMAAPGLFTPIEIDGRMLVDGGLVSNLPVQTARDMGADVVIAIDIGSPLRKRENIHSPLDVTDQMIGILVGQNVKAQKELLGPNDLLISPALGELGFSDFSKSAEAIAAGEAAATAALPALRRLALDPQAYAAFRSAQLVRATPQQPRIDKIEIVTRGRVSPEFVQRYLTVEEGEIYDPGKIKAVEQAIANAGYFDSVTHELLEKDGKHELRVEVAGASWGPHLFLFGLSLNSNFEGTGAFRLYVGHRLPFITSSGLEWRNDLVLGSDILGLQTELRQPLFATGESYVAPYAEYRQQNYRLTINDVILNQPANTLTFANYQLTTARAGIDFGIPILRLGELRIGAEYAQFTNRPKSYLPMDFTQGGEGLDNFFPVSKARVVGPRVRLTFDQLDDAIFPRRGYYLFAENETSLLGGGNQYSETHAKALFAQSFGAHSFNAAFEAGGDFGVGDQAQPPGFFLGGFQRLSAYSPDQFAGNYVLYGRLTYLTPVKKFDAPPFHSFFLGASAEVGNVWIRQGDFGNGPYRQSYSVFAGLTSGLGPIYLGFAYAPGNVYNVYFQFGRPF
jgi:NTE family protein